MRRRQAPPWLAHDAVLKLFDDGEAAAAVAYERLVLDAEGPDPPEHVQGLTPDRANADA